MAPNQGPSLPDVIMRRFTSSSARHDSGRPARPSPTKPMIVLRLRLGDLFRPATMGNEKNELWRKTMTADRRDEHKTLSSLKNLFKLFEFLIHSLLKKGKTTFPVRYRFSFFHRLLWWPVTLRNTSQPDLQYIEIYATVRIWRARAATKMPACTADRQVFRSNVKIS